MQAHEQHILLGQPIHYTLPSDLRFDRLVEASASDSVRLRFARDAVTIVDIPLSGETLAALAVALSAYSKTKSQDVTP
jgi:hypothetical protein